MFGRKPLDVIAKESILNLKTVKIKGIKFVIKKVNPYVDFSAENMPQIFTEHRVIDDKKECKPPTPEDIDRIHKAMRPIIEAGLYSPALVKEEKDEKAWKEKGVTMRDLFLDEEIGSRLYVEIMNHSLNKFKGIKGLFFSIKIKHLLYRQFRGNMGLPQQM